LVLAACYLLRGPRSIEDRVAAGTPVELTERLKDWLGDRPARVFAPLGWSDYLLWQLPPTAQVFMYTHYEAFPPTALRHANRILAMRPPPNGWRSLLKDYRIDVLALADEDPGKALFAHFREGKEPGWRVIYVNDEQTELIAVRELK
jgi:hypothetical protein